MRTNLQNVKVLLLLGIMCLLGGGKIAAQVTYVYEKVTSEDQLVAGGVYLIVCESSKVALSKQDGKFRDRSAITVSSDKTINLASNGIATSSTESKPFELILGGEKDAWTFYDPISKGYFYCSKEKNLTTGKTASNFQITIDSDENATINVSGITGCRFLYNVNSPRFLPYKSATTKSMLLPQLYRKISTLKISEAGFATLYTDTAFQMPEGVAGYTVTDGGDKLSLNKTYSAGDAVPAKTPLLLHGAANTYTYPVLINDETAPTDNLLHGTTAAEETNAGDGTYKYYKLSYDDNGENLGFYYAAADGAAFTNAAGKAYLAIPTSAEASKMQGFAFGDLDQTTAIRQVNTLPTAAPAAAYDLNGRRVNNLQHAAKGIYIVNGKKVLVK